jgi:hypothetical protein
MAYAKAITAAIIVGLGSLDVAFADNVVSWQEGIKCGIATLGALAGVWAVPNAAKKVKRKK